MRARVELNANQSTVAALFIDVRTGFVYGLSETTAKASGLTNAWGSRDTVDRKRLDAEREAFGRFIPEAERTWADIAKRYASRYIHTSRRIVPMQADVRNYRSCDYATLIAPTR
jgi:hypothetical protein